MREVETESVIKSFSADLLRALIEPFTEFQETKPNQKHMYVEWDMPLDLKLGLHRFVVFIFNFIYLFF